MPEITVKAHLLPALDGALAGLFPISPPPTPKGRYALAKASKVIGPAAATYAEQVQALREKHATKDGAGKPVTQDLGSGRVRYVMPDEAAFNADVKAIGDEDVTLPGVRMISRVELGACPITVQIESILLGILLEDTEPTE